MSKRSAELCGPVSHDEAERIAMGYIDHAFGNPEKYERRVTHSIPANHARDSDLRLTAYIEQQRQREADLQRELEQERSLLDRLATAAGARIAQDGNVQKRTTLHEVLAEYYRYEHERAARNPTPKDPP